MWVLQSSERLDVLFQHQLMRSDKRANDTEMTERTWRHHCLPESACFYRAMHPWSLSFEEKPVGCVHYYLIHVKGKWESHKEGLLSPLGQKWPDASTECQDDRRVRSETHMLAKMLLSVWLFEGWMSLFRLWNYMFSHHYHPLTPTNPCLMRNSAEGQRWKWKTNVWKFPPKWPFSPPGVILC